MKERVKITMVGGKNVGKTCFLHAMYYTMRRGVNNFYLHTPEVDADSRLTNAWANMRKKGKDRRWPVPTSENISWYNFEFKLGLNRTLTTFDWVDYRGGALLEESANSQDLIDHLNDSDALIFCLDGAELKTSVKDRLFEVDNRLCISRAKVLLNKLTRRVPIVVLITKHDVCRHRRKDELMADIKELFHSWLARGENWDVLICPVTLGRQLAEDPKGGDLSPKNMHVPVVYSIFSIVLESLVASETRAKEAFENQQKAEAVLADLNSGFFSRLKKAEVEKARLEVEKFQRLRASEDRAADRLRSDVQALGKELTSQVMYCDGQLVGIGESVGGQADAGNPEAARGS